MPPSAPARAPVDREDQALRELRSPALQVRRRRCHRLARLELVGTRSSESRPGPSASVARVSELMLALALLEARREDAARRSGEEVDVESGRRRAVEIAEDVACRRRSPRRSMMIGKFWFALGPPSRSPGSFGVTDPPARPPRRSMPRYRLSKIRLPRIFVRPLRTWTPPMNEISLRPLWAMTLPSPGAVPPIVTSPFSSRT